MEIWKDIKGYEGAYQVSNCGNIKSLERWRINGKGGYVQPSKILKKSLSSTGYYKIWLNKNGKRKQIKIHRLVAMAFIPNPNDKPFINHIDSDPLNNHVDNLEWCTQSENVQHAYEYGKRESNFHKFKEIIKAEYLENEKVGVWELARKYQCSHPSITKYLRKNKIKLKTTKELKDKYNINRVELVKDFEENKLTNSELAIKYNASNMIIATYRYRHKKGVFKF